MKSDRPKSKTPTAPSIRCAIYSRKSSEEGLQQEFNSLDAQREAAEAYIASQKAEGWVCLPDRYDDGGFTGGNMDRPALKRLIADIDNGSIDCVVVYKVDRLSRSLMDFARIMETFDKQHVSFVSVTQHFNTTHSMGRLTLNILLSFAQFEREIIGERIRDKIAASRQRGKWTGGTPVLGYDVDRSTGNPRLVINPSESAQVRQIFELYLEHGSLLSVVPELERRDWRCKVWSTRDGRHRGGLPFDKCRLHQLLTNVLYIGKVKHKDQTHPGEHEAIVVTEVFERVQRQLSQNRNGATAETRNRYGALLRGLLTCKACGKAMVHTLAKRGNKCYRYYVCSHAIKNGSRKCPSGSLPAAEIERAVVDQIRCIGQDKALLADTLRQAQTQTKAAMQGLVKERNDLRRALSRYHGELKRIATVGSTGNQTATRIAGLNEQIGKAEKRLPEVEQAVAELERARISEADVARAFADFDGLWKTLSSADQVRLIHLLVQRVEFDVTDSSIEIAFHATGIKTLDGMAIEATDAAPTPTGRRRPPAAKPRRQPREAAA